MAIFKPYGYQAYCIDRIVNMPIHGPGLGLYLEMGLGKSVITLSAVKELKYNRFTVSKVLVIAPKRVAEATWQKEIQKWEHLKLLRVSTVLGTAKQRIKALNTPADIWVINRDNISFLVDYYRNDWPFDMVVIDESSSFKNHQAKRFKSLTWVRSKISRIVELTGTPAPNGLIDMWAQVYLLDGGERLGKTIGGFRQRYFDPDQRNAQQVFSYKPKDGAGDTIQDKISDICISMKASDYLELPDCIYDDIPVELDSKAKTAYKKLERDMLLEVDEDEITATTAAVLGNKLLQLGNGAVYGEDHKAVEIHQCKIEAFLEVVEALQGQSALVFYNFKHDRDRLIAALSKSGLRVRVYQDAQDEADWNNHKIDILLAHPASTAYGLNLQDGGNHIIWFGLNWSLELYQQANKRLHRQGQKERVFIHNLIVQGSMDEDVMDALQGKSTTQESLLKALRVRIEKAKEEK
ncbi:DEAD/DEAH box helicase [Clostridium sp. KNHs216]|uniref:DEAD/DEAH box helicase n=1 Tax=Clostridium sp. KNHs216 TaxID=1550235 RepID=UPI0011682F37|nr:SNF2 domain-containing protein [Clostridium sp. KNHs216]